MTNQQTSQDTTTPPPLTPQQHVNKRNTETIVADIKRLQLAHMDVLEQLAKMNQGISALQTRINELDLRATLQKVQMTGRGPSVVATTS